MSEIHINRPNPNPRTDADFDLDLRLNVIGNLAEPLGLPVKNSRHQDTVDLIFAQLVLVAWCNAEHWVAISRDKNFYGHTQPYRHSALTYRNVVNALKALRDAGLIKEQRSRPSSQSIYKSRYRLLATLLDEFPIRSISDLAFCPSNLVKLKDHGKHLIRYQDTEKTHAMRRELLAQNEAIASICISLDISRDPADWHIDAHGLLRNGDTVVNPRKLALYRVFMSSDTRI